MSNADQYAIAAAFQAAHLDALPRDSVMGVAYGYPFSDADMSGPVGIVVLCFEGKSEKIKQAMPATHNDLPVFVEELEAPTPY